MASRVKNVATVIGSLLIWGVMFWVSFFATLPFLSSANAPFGHLLASFYATVVVLVVTLVVSFIFSISVKLTESTKNYLQAGKFKTDAGIRRTKEKEKQKANAQ